jgi:hypothetical protein
MVEDESIFVHDILIRRRMWTSKEIRPIVVTSVSHQKTYMYLVQLPFMVSNYLDSTKRLISILSFHTFEN